MKDKPPNKQGATQPQAPGPPVSYAAFHSVSCASCPQPPCPYLSLTPPPSDYTNISAFCQGRAVSPSHHSSAWKSSTTTHSTQKMQFLHGLLFIMKNRSDVRKNQCLYYGLKYLPLNKSSALQPLRCLNCHPKTPGPTQPEHGQVPTHPKKETLLQGRRRVNGLSKAQMPKPG